MPAMQSEARPFIFSQSLCVRVCIRAKKPENYLSEMNLTCVEAKHREIIIFWRRLTLILDLERILPLTSKLLSDVEILHSNYIRWLVE